MGLQNHPDEVVSSFRIRISLLSSGGKFETQSRNGTHTLKISKIEMNEGETYEIDVGGLVGSCFVTVLEAEKRPVLNWKPKKIEAKAGEPCTVKASRPRSFCESGVKRPSIFRFRFKSKEHGVGIQSQ